MGNNQWLDVKSTNYRYAEIYYSDPDAEAGGYYLSGSGGTNDGYNLLSATTLAIAGISNIENVVVNTSGSSSDYAAHTIIEVTFTATADENINVKCNGSASHINFDGDGVTSHDYKFSISGAANAVPTVVVSITPSATKESTPPTITSIASYLTQRARAIAAGSPDIGERLRGGPQGAQGNTLGFAAVGNDENLRVSFNTSLRGMAAQREQARRKSVQAEMVDSRIGQAFSLNDTYALAYGPEVAKVDAAPAEASQTSQNYVGFDAWASGTYVHVNSGTSKSDIGLIHSGVDYRFNDQLLVGVLAQFDYDKSEDGTLNASGWGYMVGPYIAAEIVENVFFDSTAIFGQSFNDIDTGAATGKFNTDRFMVTAKLSGDIKLGANVTLTPFVKGVYFWEKQRSYTDSLATVIPEQTINLASVEFGPKLSTSFKQDNGTVINTSLTLSGIYASETGTQSIRAKIGSGLGMSFVSGVNINFLAFYDGLGDNDYEAYGATAKVRVPF